MYSVAIKKYIKSVVLCLWVANSCNFEFLYAYNSLDEESRQQEADNDDVAKKIKKARKKRRKEMYDQLDSEEDEVEEENENKTPQRKQNLHADLEMIFDAKDEAIRKQLFAALYIIKDIASPEVYQRHKIAVKRMIKENRKLSSICMQDIYKNFDNFTSLLQETYKKNKKLILALLRAIKKHVPDEYEFFSEKTKAIFEMNEEIITELLGENRDQFKEVVQDIFESPKNAKAETNFAYQREEEEYASELHYFTPKMPKPLMQEEKEIDINQRIAQKYIGEIPSQVQDLIYYFTNHEKCIENDLSIHNRLLLHGIPGTGKSYLVQVLAEQLELPLLSFTASFFGDKYIGESSRRIRKAFNVAKTYGKPILIFIDEIDALATKRKDSTHNEHRAALLTLLTEMQGVQDNKNIFIIAATNDFKVLDEAIKDRFSGAICEIKELSVQERAQLITKIFAERGKAIDANFALRLAEVTKSGFFVEDKNRFSNRDIVYIITTALLKHFADYSQDPEHAKHFCFYVRATMNAMNKKGKFAWFSPIYSNGI